MMLLFDSVAAVVVQYMCVMLCSRYLCPQLAKLINKRGSAAPVIGPGQSLPPRYPTAMTVTIDGLARELQQALQRLTLSETQSQQIAEALEKLRKDSDGAIRELNNKVNEMQMSYRAGGEKEDRVDLIDVRNMDPGTFSGSATESWRQWAKRMKAFCNARSPGFRAALDWAEAETVPINEDSLKVLSWAPASKANSKLYDLLIMKLADDPLIQVENHLGNGFEAWRSLANRFDPVGEMFTFDKMTSLMHRERCKSINELPAALERWTRDLQQYEKKSGKTLQEDMRAPIVFQMIPQQNYSDIKLKWKNDKTKDIRKFIVELIEYANELRFEQPRTGKGPSPMDVDAMSREQPQPHPQPEDWPYDPETGCYYYPVDWMGKGGKKGGGKGTWAPKGGKWGADKGTKGGKLGKGTGCHWCGKEGHRKSECRDFAKWKTDKDEERRKAGLPPYRAPGGKGVAAVEPGAPSEGNGEGEDYVGFKEYDAGSLELGGVESLECDVDAMECCGECHYDSSDESEDWIPVKATKFGAGRSHRGCATGCECEINTTNRFGMLNDEDQEHIDTLDYDFMQDRQTDPWASGSADTPGTETMAEKFKRERQELLSKFQPGGELGPALPRSPPGILAPQKPEKKVMNTEIELTKAGKATELTVITKPPTQESIATQTDVHLEHSVRAVTWIPVIDQLEPVHDIDNEYVEDLRAGEAECIEERQAEPVNKILESGSSPEGLESRGSVNDVDSLEIHRSELGEDANFMDGLTKFFIIYIFIVYISIFSIRDMEKERRKEAKPLNLISNRPSIYNLESEHVRGNPSISGGNPSSLRNPSVSGGNRAEQQGSGGGERTSRRESLVRSMKLKMKRGITLDSGSHHNVMPKRLVNTKKIRPSPGSKAGMHYVAANKGKIPNEGEIDFEFYTEEGSWESWLFQIAEVNKALAAIADRVDNNFRVVFDKDFKTGMDSSYMLNKTNNKVIKSTRVGNVWVINAIVNAEDVGVGGFGRLG